MKRQFGVDIKVLRSDGGGEYADGDFQKYLRTKGIMWQHSAPRTPQQNGKSERANRTIMEMARCLLEEAQLPHRYWEYAVLMAVYIRNGTPTRANADQKSPFEVLFGELPNLKEMTKFGARCMVHVPDERRGKLDAKAHPCIFLGYVSGAKAAVFEDVKSGRRFISRDSVEVTSPPGGAPLQTGPREDADDLVDTIIARDLGPHSGPPPSRNGPNRPPELTSDHMTEYSREIGCDPQSDLATAGKHPESQPSGKRSLPRRSTRERRTPNFLHWEYARAVTEKSTLEPASAHEALRDAEWRSSMGNEIRSLQRNGTWDLVPLPQGRRPVSGKWVLKAKTNSDGKMVRRKSRYVARGLTQQPGVDFDETFSPVVALTSLRALLATAARLEMEIIQLDVDCAYLYGSLSEEIYLKQPKGFTERDPDGRRLV